MGTRALMLVAGGGGVAKLAQNNDAGGATIDAKSTAGADIVIDGEYHVVVGVFTWLFGANRVSDGIGGNHMDALPRADVDAAFAGDAFALINVDELFWFDGLGQPCSVDFLQNIIGAEFGKWWIRVENTH
jgi:hypothetical protein